MKSVTVHARDLRIDEMSTPTYNPALLTVTQTMLRVVIGFLFAAHGW